MESKSCIEEITDLITRQAANDAGLIYPEQPPIIRCLECKYCDKGFDEEGQLFLKCLNSRIYGGIGNGFYPCADGKPD